jgi:lysozyme
MPQRKTYYVSGGAALAAATAAALTLVAPHTAKFEGKVNHTYVDRMAKPPRLTICYGHTGKDVRMGQSKTDRECLALLIKDEKSAADAVAKISPEIVGNPWLYAAATDFAFNAGAYSYQKSGMARLNHQFQYDQACQYYNKYVFAGGKPWKGLVARRVDLSKLCLEGIGK